MGPNLSRNGDDGGESGSGEIFAEINITPLTDIFLVLLIIFMVTSSVINSSGVDVDLPAASKALSQSQEDPVIVTLLSSGQMKMGSVTVSPGDWPKFESTLRQAFTQTASKLVVLEGDRKVYLGSAIELMDHAKQAGAAQFAIATENK